MEKTWSNAPFELYIYYDPNEVEFADYGTTKWGDALMNRGISGDKAYVLYSWSSISANETDLTNFVSGLRFTQKEGVDSATFDGKILICAQNPITTDLIVVSSDVSPENSQVNSIFHTRTTTQNNALGNHNMAQQDDRCVSEWGFNLEIWSETFEDRTFDISYNSELYELDAEACKALKGYGLTIKELKTEGKISITLTSESETAQVTENTLLAAIRFKAKSGTNGGLSAGESADWVATVGDEMKTSQAFSVAYDMNNDGAVNINDLVNFARLFGSSGDNAQADFDSSGNVDINDLVLFARNFNVTATTIEKISYSAEYKPSNQSSSVAPAIATAPSRAYCRNGIRIRRNFACYSGRKCNGFCDMLLF